MFDLRTRMLVLWSASLQPHRLNFIGLHMAAREEVALNTLLRLWLSSVLVTRPLPLCLSSLDVLLAVPAMRLCKPCFSLVVLGSSWNWPGGSTPGNLGERSIQLHPLRGTSPSWPHPGRGLHPRKSWSSEFLTYQQQPSVALCHSLAGLLLSLWGLGPQLCHSSPP